MIGLVRQLNALCNRRERWQLVILSIALVVRAAVEMVGVGIIAPFMSVVADTSAIERNSWLRGTYEYFDFASDTAFLTFFGAAVIAMLAVSNAISAIATWGMLRFSWGLHHRLSMRLLRGYLAQPYSFFVQRNSASFSKSILTEVQTVINGVLTPVLNIVSRSLVVLALTGLLVVLEPYLALVMVVVLGGAYGLLYMLVKAKQRRLGRERIAANGERYKITNEAFGGIKDVKVLQRESAFADRFAPQSWVYSKATASNALVAQLPRYLFETIAFSGVVLIVLYYLRAGHGIAHVLPTISLYAFAGYRLMPELQQLFAAIAQIRFSQAALDDLTEDLQQFGSSLEDRSKPPAPELRFDREIRVESTYFRYSGSREPALKGVSITIPKNQTIGLVGASGSGKTTLVDLLLGLYEPSSGRILVDGVELDEKSVRAWRPQIGYVPQHIFLSDDTIANNIAFGVPSDAVDLERVERAARIAHLHDFIDTLPAKYQTVVGERGVRLSGGQRQRIGIARALYHGPSVLVMDEATSALDGATEDAVMQAIGALSGQMTIILIAHRLSTVQACDRIHLLGDGRVLETGTYDELLQRSEVFRAMAKVGALDTTGTPA